MPKDRNKLEENMPISLIICGLGQLYLFAEPASGTPRVFPGFGEKLGSDVHNYYVWKQRRDLGAAKKHRKAYINTLTITYYLL